MEPIPITENTLLSFEERTYDLAACLARIDDIVSGDSLPLRTIVQTIPGTPHEQALRFAEELCDCCDMRLRAEGHWLECDDWGTADVDLSMLPSTLDEQERATLTCLFYCAARLTTDSPWLEDTVRDFIDLVALPRPTDKLISWDDDRPRIAFTPWRNDADWTAVFAASEPTDALDRFAIAFDLLKYRDCSDMAKHPDQANPPDEDKHGAPHATTEAQPGKTASPEGSPAAEDFPFVPDEASEREREQAEREFAETERAALTAWRTSFADADDFCAQCERLHELWRASAIPTNAGGLARTGIDMTGMRRGASLYRDDATYYAALETMKDALAKLQRLVQGAHS
ncbi:MAG: hypothetical protein Q4B69_00055 [Slackia sp.]|nr:hypothetical protein [Slackia sp.]